MYTPTHNKFYKHTLSMEKRDVTGLTILKLEYNESY